MEDVKELAPDFYNKLDEFGWMPLTEPTGDFNENWVREFHAMLPPVVWEQPNPTIKIRGKDVSVSAG